MEINTNQLFNMVINLEAMLYMQQQVIEKLIQQTGVIITPAEFEKFANEGKKKVSETYPNANINW